MKRLAGLMLALLAPVLSFAQEADEGGGIDAAINNALSPAADFVSGIVFYTVPVAGADLPIIVVWLVVAAVFFTFYFNFVNFRSTPQAWRLIRGDYFNKDDAGEVTHFQAIATALSGTVGLGNIAGVAVAVSLGGPGATFWMIVAGLFGMASKFVECTLGVKYRQENEDGSVSGGPMHYLSKGLASKGMAGFGKGLATFFAICCIGGALGGGNMFQSNQAFQQLVNVTGDQASWFADKGWLFGITIAVLVGIVIIGGIKSIARVTEKIVPFMGITYVLAALVILIANFQQIPTAFSAIFAGAFTGAGITGGFVGVLIQGFRRAAFSNEAGIGSSAIAHSAVKTDEPITEGLVALHEPFVDTVIVCTMTALVIVITGVYTQPDLGGVQLTSAAFAANIGWFPLVLALAVNLFAFSTMISWSYYGVKAWTYLFGEGDSREIVFKVIFCIFTALGAMVSLDAVIAFSDSMIFLMSIPNIIGLYILAPEIKKALNSYWERINSGEIKTAAEREQLQGAGD